MEASLITLFSALIAALSGIVMTIIGVVGLVFAAREFYRNKTDKERSKLAKDAYALYYVEQQAMKELAELKEEIKTTQTAQRYLRDKAVQLEGNLRSLRPKYTVTDYEKYITD